MLLSSHDVTLLFGVFCWRPCSPQGYKALLSGPLDGGTMWSHSSRLVHAHIIQREDLHLRGCDAKRKKVLSEQLKTSHCWCPTLTRWRGSEGGWTGGERAGHDEQAADVSATDVTDMDFRSLSHLCDVVFKVSGRSRPLGDRAENDNRKPHKSGSNFILYQFVRFVGIFFFLYLGKRMCLRSGHQHQWCFFTGRSCHGSRVIAAQYKDSVWTNQPLKQKKNSHIALLILLACWSPSLSTVMIEVDADDIWMQNLNPIYLHLSLYSVRTEGAAGSHSEK